MLPVEDFEHNKKVLNVGEHNYLLLKYGGHNIIGQEPATAAFFSIKIKQKLKPIYMQIINKEIV